MLRCLHKVARKAIPLTQLGSVLALASLLPQDARIDESWLMFN